MTYHLATSNIARMLGAYEDEVMAGFVARLEPLNALADSSPGFVWRYQDESGDATEIRVFDDQKILFNMSVWESPEALQQYAYHGEHLEALQSRAKWFARATRPSMVLWWVRVGHIPTVEEAKEHFEILWRDGPGAAAFTFKEQFPAPQT